MLLNSHKLYFFITGMFFSFSLIAVKKRKICREREKNNSCYNYTVLILKHLSQETVLQRHLRLITQNIFICNDYEIGRMSLFEEW